MQSDAQPLSNLAATLLQLGRKHEAAARFREALALLTSEDDEANLASSRSPAVEAERRALAQKARRGLEMAMVSSV